MFVCDAAKEMPVARHCHPRRVVIGRIAAARSHGRPRRHAAR